MEAFSQVVGGSDAPAAVQLAAAKAAAGADSTKVPEISDSLYISCMYVISSMYA